MPIILDKILGIDESINPELLPKDKLAALKNMVLDYPGYKFSPKKRGAWTQFNTNSIGTDSFASLKDVQILSSAGAEVNYLLGISGTKLRKSLDGTASWSDVKTGLTSDQKMRFAVYNNKIICTNGADAPFQIEGDTLGTVNNLEIEVPDVQATTLSVDSGGDLDANANYVYVIVNVTATGEKSNISTPLNIATTTNKKITFANIPVATDARVTSKKIYRTKGGEETFYLLATLGTAETSYVDYASDDLLDSEVVQIITVPTKAKYILSHKDRIILGNVTKKTENKIFPPTPINALTQGTGGNITDGDYRYKYSYVDSEGVESRLSPYKAITISAGGGTASVALKLDQPYVGASANRYNNIKYWRVYRAKKTGSVWGDYKKTYDFQILPLGYPTPFNGTTDYLADGSLGAVYSAATVNLPNTILWSEDQQPSTINDLSILPVYPDDGGGITGLLDDEDGFWVIKDNSFIKIYTSNAPEGWQPYKVLANKGCDVPESLVKHDKIIYFVWSKKVYRFPDFIDIPISETRKSLFDSMTLVSDACYFKTKSWYCLIVKDASLRYLMCFDEKLETWYYFTMTYAFALTEKQYGANKGKLIKGNGYVVGGTFVAYYDETATSDTETGSTVQIDIQIRTKTFTMDDGISLARLRRMLMSYYKTNALTFTITFTNPRNGQSSTITITNTGSGFDDLTQIIDAMTGTISKPQAAVYMNISGQGMVLFNVCRIEYNPVRRGRSVITAG